VRFVGEGRRRAPDALVPEEPLENRLNVVGAAENALEPRPAAAEAQHDQVAALRIARALPVDDDGRADLEVGLADEELSPAGELGDEELSGRRQAAICSSSAN
jgi:hypothetical protein